MRSTGTIYAPPSCGLLRKLTTGWLCYNGPVTLALCNVSFRGSRVALFGSKRLVMLKYLVLLATFFLASCGGDSSSDETSDGSEILILSHPLKGNWISSCVDWNLKILSIGGVPNPEQYWITVEYNISDTTIVEKIYVYTDVDCEELREDSVPNYDVIETLLKRVDVHTTANGYEFTNYVVGSGEGEFILTSIAIIDNIPYIVVDESEVTSETNYLVKFEWYLERK